ncbi:MAG: CRISPR-associated RAMP protein [Anaerolineae bacterium]|nr:CRISPR-associated RAMP protein [Anaerolineae bacterium]
MSTNWDFSRFHSRLRLVGTLTVGTALRVGSGVGEGMTGADITVVKDAVGRPFIPGSSFKGVLRTEVERIARTIDKRPLLWACDDPLNDAGRCVTNADMEALKGKDEAVRTEEVLRKSCPVCRIFGSPWLASKMLVKDLGLKDPARWPERFPVRDGVGIDRDTGTVAVGPYTYETVPPGTEFTCEIVLENADEFEQGVVLLGLREFQEGRAGLGGGRSRGLGQVFLAKTWDQVEYVDPRNRAAFLDYLAGSKGQPLKPEELADRITRLRDNLV